MASRSAAIDSSMRLQAMVVGAANVYMNNKEKCTACAVVPEDVMVLSCAHCICLPCASAELQGQGGPGNCFIHCNRCQEITLIDQELYKQLMESVISASKASKRQQHVHNRQMLMRQERRTASSGFDSDLQRTCNWHAEDPIMYVCKTCNDAFICPECLINGCHKNHEANLILKEGERIKGRLQQDLSRANEKIEQLQRMQQARVGSIEQRRRQLEKLRNSAKQQYEAIKEAISKEENTVMAKCNELIAAHQKQEQSFKLDIAHQIKMYEQQRIDLIDLLNPLLEQSIAGQSRALHKMMMVNLVESYQRFAKASQRDRESYIKIAEEKMEEELEVIQSLTKKIDRISLAHFYQPKQEADKNSGPNVAKKYNYPKTEIPTNSNPQPMRAKQYPSNEGPFRRQTMPKNDFFNLL